jgi:hypothetical protein
VSAKKKVQLVVVVVKRRKTTENDGRRPGTPVRLSLYAWVDRPRWKKTR